LPKEPCVTIKEPRGFAKCDLLTLAELSAANGDVYLGEFERGKFHGRGLLHMHDGAFFKGEWFHGKKHGNGTMYYANGDLYEGAWKDDLRSGWGILWLWDGELSVCRWVVCTCGVHVLDLGVGVAGLALPS
jgi:hypothetical protein